MAADYIVIFVEGETEKEFYRELLNYYRSKQSHSLKAFRIIDIRGITRFENKMGLIVQNDILKKYDAGKVHIICCHDTDVFDFARKPPVDWVRVKNRMNRLGIGHFEQVKAKRMIEDWFIMDVDGLCKFLKLKAPKKMEGKDGYDKIKKLFKMGGKIYIKGTYSQKFIPHLDMALVRIHAQVELEKLEKALGVKIK